VKTFWIIGLATDIRPIPPAETAPQAFSYIYNNFLMKPWQTLSVLVLYICRNSITGPCLIFTTVFWWNLGKHYQFWSYIHICRNSATGLFLHLQHFFMKPCQKLSVLVLYMCRNSTTGLFLNLQQCFDETLANLNLLITLILSCKKSHYGIELTKWL
jgi:hypothetical protein